MTERQNGEKLGSRIAELPKDGLWGTQLSPAVPVQRQRRKTETQGKGGPTHTHGGPRTNKDTQPPREREGQTKANKEN